MNVDSESSDLDPSDALDHPRRELIYELVQEQPGLNWNQMRRASDLSVGAVLFHLEKLEEAGAILRRESTNENEVLFFTEDNVDMWRDPSTRVLFGNDSTRRVARALIERPGSSIQELADRVGVHYVTVRYHLKKLKDHKLVIEVEDGRKKLYHPVERMRECMEEIGDGIGDEVDDATSADG